ncbi:MAG: DUF896 domain-containing protein [Clostridia bacterium]|nr:DUF896 domain-containing protein [Clostridia bacterium]
MSPEKIARINELARIAKTRELTEAERLERAELRTEYLEDFRKHFRAQLDSTVVVRPDGTRESLRKAGENAKSSPKADGNEGR